MKNFRKHFKYILPLVVIIMIGGLIFSRVYQPEPSLPDPEIQINAIDADKYIGTVAEVCEEVASSRYLPAVGGKPTFLNLGQPYPDQFFTVVIWEDHRNKWDTPPEQWYVNKKICVSGMIETHKGTPQIIVENPGQIEVQLKE